MTTRAAARWPLGRRALLAIGLVTSIAAAVQGADQIAFVKHASSAVGRVLPTPGVAGGVSSAHPVLEFTAKNGRVVRYRQNGMGERPVGTAVPLLYDARDPAGTAIAVGFWTLWFPTLGTAALGLALVALALAGAELAPRRSPG